MLFTLRSCYVTISLFAIVIFTAQTGIAADRVVSPLANSHEKYRLLRELALDDAVRVDGLEVRRDLARFRLTGTVTFGAAVDGRRPLAVFSGEGELIFEPSLTWEQKNLELHIGRNSLRENFKSAVFWFTDDSEQEIRNAATPATVDAKAADSVQRLRARLRQRDKRPRSSLQAVLEGEDMDNVEAVILRALAHHAREGVFLAYLNGNKYSDLRFSLRPSGGLPQMLSPEETALVHVRPGAQWRRTAAADAAASMAARRGTPATRRVRRNVSWSSRSSAG